MTDCATCADLREQAAHWQNMAAAYLAAAKAGIAAKARDSGIRPALPVVADAAPSGVPVEGQPNLRAVERRTA